MTLNSKKKKVLLTYSMPLYSEGGIGSQVVLPARGVAILILHRKDLRVRRRERRNFSSFLTCQKSIQNSDSVLKNRLKGGLFSTMQNSWKRFLWEWKTIDIVAIFALYSIYILCMGLHFFACTRGDGYDRWEIKRMFMNGTCELVDLFLAEVILFC